MKIDALSQLLDVILDDLSARFIINLPEEELSSVTRICFGLEQAHWFYEDFFRPQYPALPSVNLRAFTAALFSHCPLLWKFSGQHEAAFDDFLKYKIRVPVRGAIMLNKTMEKCVLVKGWKSSAGWGFPKGKIDQGEDDADCAVREVREECGYDISPYIRSEDFVDLVMKEQSVRLYVVRGIPEDTKFEPQTRKEISKIDWFSLNDLPTFKKDAAKEVNKNHNKYYMVAPFLGPLRRWIKKNKTTTKIKKSGDGVRPSTPSVSANLSVPTPGTSTPVPASIDSTEASSQALKLLLGIASGSAGEAVKESPLVPVSNAGKADEGRIDLASLFQKPLHTSVQKTDGRDTMAHHSEASVPFALLNTSIETSISAPLQSVQHGRHATGLPISEPPPNLSLQHLQLDNDHPRAHYSPFSSHQQLPPWMLPNPHMIPAYNPTQSMYPSQRNMVPMPPPNIHELQSAHAHQSSAVSGFSAGPPGLGQAAGLARPPVDSRSSRQPINANAQALLAILKPASRPSITSEGGNLLPSNQMPPATGAARYPPSRQSIHPPRPPHEEPDKHTQSLLALLQPTGNTALARNDTRNQMPTSAATHEARPSQPTSRDTFLLDYLTRAVNGA